MGRRNPDAKVPEYYTGPTWRPHGRWTFDTPEQIAWDQIETWQTTAEWLAWVRRRDGGKIRWDGKRWVYPMRPIIHATRYPWFTTRMRQLPRDGD